MAIKSVGGPGSAAATQAANEVAKASETQRPNAATFAPAEPVAPAAEATQAAPAEPLDVAVREVAERVNAGGLATPEARVEAVIARVVELQLGDGVQPSVARERAREAQIALADHPTFAQHVHTLLDAAIAE